MKILFFIGFVAIFAITSGVFVPPRPGHKQPLLGAKECTWGPSYWCQNLTAAADCRAVKHCIQTVWIHKNLPPDNSEVCQTCLDMVKQARDQLLSNDTQELIKEVFEGSCDLLRIKPIVKECIKVADDYIPELVDTLASQMNPQVVCHVAGLCNNERIHKMIEDSKNQQDNTPKKPDTCEGCHTVVDVMQNKLNKASRDDILQGFLTACGKLGSFSDACSNVIVTYFTEIYNFLLENFNSNDVCLMAGECSALFHTHNVEITPKSHIGYVPVSGDDLPCELCEQLVQHLRDLLIANTTESEFKQVLDGLCKQTNSFKDECLNLVEQYYDVAYGFLINDLNSTVACGLIGICPASDKNVYIAPLLPVETAPKALELSDKPDFIRVGLKKSNSNVKVIPPPAQAQLPIDLLMPPHTQVLYNKDTCIFCEYFLHFIQEDITDPKTEAKIEDVLENACRKLPSSINNTCVGFVSAYGPALVAILAQDIDPSRVCPLLKLCPGENAQEIEIFMQQESSENCPLCLFAVTKLESMVKDNKTEANIKSALNQLCSHLSQELRQECNDFVQTYTDELVEMLVADFKPSEVCVFLKLCTENRPVKNLPDPVFNTMIGGDIETNIIPDDTINGKPIGKLETTASPQCVLCEYVMSKIENTLDNNATDEEIKHAVRGICNIMPKAVKIDCNKFVDEYGDVIINLLIEALSPADICTYIGLCTGEKIVPIQEQINDEVLGCVICEATLNAITNILNNPKVDHHYDHVLEKACRGLPLQYRTKCYQLMLTRGNELLHISLDKSVSIHDQWQSCYKLFDCVREIEYRVRREVLVGNNPCTWGPGHWCASPENAQNCGTESYCQEKVWKSKTKRQVKAVGTKKCTYGPSYWCASEANADECNARQHCEERVWKTRSKRQNEQLLGAEKCTWGPSYWCENEENADKCGARKHCEEKVWKSKTKRQVKAVGTKKCTYGPSYWCASEANADECNARQHCEERVWKTRSKRQNVPVLGAEKCTWGPSYWCENEENADECGARKHCEEKVWKSKTKRQVKAVGTKKCTYGPSYWCASEANADECNARQHCEERVWKTRSKRQNVPVLGAEKCTWGPSYWCDNEENADKCGARKHCEEKVWKTRSKRQNKPVLGAKKCTYGPSYWCASEANADECNARKHCEEKVWKSKASN